MEHISDNGGSGVWVGHTVTDESHKKIGKVVDVLYEDDTSNTPDWAVVRTGPLGGDHFLPLSNAYRTRDERVVVPYDSATVKKAPRAPREHIFPIGVKEQALEHYGVDTPQ